MAGKPRRTASIERVMRFVVTVLEERRATGGWVTVDELVAECGVSKVTAYRYLTCLEAIGLPIVRDVHESGQGRQDSAGVRTLVQLTARKPDTLPVELRRRPKHSGIRRDQEPTR